MTPAILLLAIAVLIIFYPVFAKRSEVAHEKEAIKDDRSATISRKLMEVAVEAIKDRKTYRAEKALLTLLKIDERNATAYNRLGILYAKQKKYKEAIECFEIANGIEPNAASLHNAGLIYFERENYENAALMFSRAIELEGDASVHYSALAKSEIKLGNRLKAIEALESAYDIAPSVALLKGIQQIYLSAEDEEAAQNIEKRIAALEKEEANKAIAAKVKKHPAVRRIARKSPTIKSAQRKINRSKKS